MGTIDYKYIDAHYKDLTKEALKWIKDCKSQEAKTWDITKIPFPRKELYPNMCNQYDYPWRLVKETIANNIKEITSLWMIGVKNREISHSHGVYKWTNNECNLETLGVKGPIVGNILSKILEINKPQTRSETNIKPLIIQNNLEGWKNPKKIEFYVDFETITNVMTDFKHFPYVENNSMIFMIGVGYIEPFIDHWVYKNFTVNCLDLLEEKKICLEFVEYISSVSKVHKVNSPSCVHWAHAEQTFWSKAVDRHTSAIEDSEWIWLDLLKIFKKEPIVIKGCLNFNLKNVAKAMKSHGCIACDWDGESSCIDGTSAMIGVWNAQKEANLRNISLIDTPLIQDIIKYNEIDVKVLYEIITYLRKNHICDVIE